MYMPLPLHTHVQTYHQLPISNEPYEKSLYPQLQYSYNDEEQILKSGPFAHIKSQLKQPLTGSSFYMKHMKMQAHKTSSISVDSAIGVPSRLCSVCGDASTGIHFGGNSCESCKAFFRRSVQCNRYQNYKCSNEERCPVNIVTRKVCQFCRYKKCTIIGMKPKWVLSDQEREEKYGPRRKRFREARALEEDPDIYKHLTKEEKSLIEDIAHALYQSRATYPLQFPNNQSNSSTTSELSASASANFLIVPIQRLVLFARMLKDFDTFSENDKVNLLKGSAIEIMICSSNTLFDPKTQKFTNYVSRDQRTLMDEEVMQLDPILLKLWGDDLFNRTKTFLISMSILNIDEVTSTLLVPVILFSPDRSNVNDLQSVKLLQVKYVTLIRKYMNWRYGVEKTDDIYAKLLLQIINIRTLSLAHAEIIQNVMTTTTTVNPLVQEITCKQDTFSKTTRESSSLLSMSSTPNDIDIRSDDKTPSVETESLIGSDEDDLSRKKSRSPMDDDAYFDNEDLNDTNQRNTWKKQQKIPSTIQTEISNIEESDSKTLKKNCKKEVKQNSVYRRPHDHQVPNTITTFDNSLSTSRTTFRHLPPKKQSLQGNRELVDEQIYHTNTSSTKNDFSSFDRHSQLNYPSNPTVFSASGQYYPLENYHQQYNHIPMNSFQQKTNGQHLVYLPRAKSQSHISPIQSPNNHSAARLDVEEQQLLDAIHAHPNKRDLVLNLLRQVNQTSISSPADYYSNSTYFMQQQQQQQHQQQQNRYQTHINMKYNPDLY